mmetsp:Transcript_42709/g.110427  ORF Transcript_42709/g.110427 Transcript_42709/m.110427 type:complete len:1187 (+) Transcript_42709:74-3634(+)
MSETNALSSNSESGNGSAQGIGVPSTSTPVGAPCAKTAPAFGRSSSPGDVRRSHDLKRRKARGGHSHVQHRGAVELEGGVAKVQKSTLSRCGSGSSSSTSSRSSSTSSDSESSSQSSDADDEMESEPSDLSGEEDVDQEVDGGFGVYKDLVVKSEPAPLDLRYRADWAGAPAVGTKGFNDFASKAMTAAGVASRPLQAKLDRSIPCPPMQPHQEVVACLMHPQSPCSRLLVDHPTGSGKTREMICVLENFFLDPRPKVPIFPKEPVCRNFYAELLRWPSRYRNFFACLRPQDAARAAGTRDWRERRDRLWDISALPEAELRQLCTSLREVLEMKGWFFMGKMRRSRRDAFMQRFPTESFPGAPLRALRYTSAGGRHTELRDDGLPVSALLKVAFDHVGKNVYSNKIVIMDEVHNLVREQTQYVAQLTRLRELLQFARGAVLAGFTGTPILSEASEGRILLDIIKGHGARRCDEGFLSSFPMRPLGLFPRSLPVGIPDAVLTPNLRRQLVHRVTLKGEPLKRYDAKQQKGVSERRLRAYCNLCVHFGSLHDGKSGSKGRILANMAACAPKLHAIALDVAANCEKALVLIARSSGMEALLAHLHAVGAASKPPFSVATMDELAAFNSHLNRRGEQYRVLVADAATCSEGVSFFAVRRVHLADVPATPSAFVQSVGRAIRMYGHAGLPSEEQTVTTVLHVAGLPRWMRSTLGAWTLRAQRRREDAKEMESSARRLLRRLLSLGIQDLQSLKARVDACGMSAHGRLPEAGKEPLDLDQVTNIMEQLGLMAEAKAVRLKQQRVPKQGGRKKARKEGLPGRFVATQELASGHSAESTARKSSKPAAPLTKKGDGAAVVLPRQTASTALSKPGSLTLRPEDDDLLASLVRPKGAAAASARRQGTAQRDVTPKQAAPQQPQQLQQPQQPLPHWRRDALVKAIQELYLASSAEEAAEKLHLSGETADEQALRRLAEQSREFVPALAELRHKAVDRTVLQKFSNDCVKDEEESAGDSSVHEFGVSDSSGHEDGSKPKEVPLVLPQGWRTQIFRRNNREVREFVDPAGRRYRTTAQARRAIDAARSAVNVAQRLRSKYVAGLAKDGLKKEEAGEDKTAVIKSEQGLSRTAVAVRALCQAIKEQPAIMQTEKDEHTMVAGEVMEAAKGVKMELDSDAETTPMKRSPREAAGALTPSKA